jgi:hypothetical protein
MIENHGSASLARWLGLKPRALSAISLMDNDFEPNPWVGVRGAHRILFGQATIERGKILLYAG